MASFGCNVVQVEAVEKHPNADRLDIVKIGDFNCIVNRKDDGSQRYYAGSHVIYVPEGAVIPDHVLKDIGFWDNEKSRGLLSGSNYNRVKAVKLRGVLSQGIIIPINEWGGFDDDPFRRELRLELGNIGCKVVVPGQDVSELLGITKYEPPIPENMAGDVWRLPEFAYYFDIDNIKKHPNLFEDGEFVWVSEKIHGTFMNIVIHNREIGEFAFGKNKNITVTSKGLLHTGLFLKNCEKNRERNVYVRKLIQILEDKGDKLDYIPAHSFVVCGELFGGNIQDLKYGMDKLHEFRVFDIFQDRSPLSLNDFVTQADRFGFSKDEIVPILGIGAYSRAMVDGFVDGPTTLNNAGHIREGVVIKPIIERRDPRLGRVMAKHISEAYLLRKDATEFT
jgi:RNA ligase (TIGR02306 family)